MSGAVASPNLCDGGDLTNVGLLKHLHARFDAGELNTLAGESVLISINPIKKPPSDGPAMDSYVGQRLSSGQAEASGAPAPHAFAVAEEAFVQLCTSDADVAVMVIGESGAGKSHQARLLLQYWWWRAGTLLGGPSSSPLASRLAAITPLMHAFGCASTPQNPDSTRFCQLLRLHLARPRAARGAYSVVGAHLSTWLVERERIVGSAGSNFHILYAACSPGALAGAHADLVGARAEGESTPAAPRPPPDPAARTAPPARLSCPAHSPASALRVSLIRARTTPLRQTSSC